MKTATRKSINRVYIYAKSANINQLKKGLIDYILDELYDLSYCRTIFECTDIDQLIRYIEPLITTRKSKNDYYRTFSEYSIKEYYYTPFFDDDNRDERIIKTYSQIALGNIQEMCYFYSLRYGFDVYRLYRFMDNNRYMSASSSSDDDISIGEQEVGIIKKRYVKRNILSKIDKDTIKMTDYNDNLRVIIAPIFPQKRVPLELGPRVDLSSIRAAKRLPFKSFSYPLYFNILDRPFHSKLPFEFKIDETIREGIYIDRTNKRIVITGLDLRTIYRCLYGDYLCYERGLNHVNGSCIATATDYYLLIDIDGKIDEETESFARNIRDRSFSDYYDLGLVVYRNPLDVSDSDAIYTTERTTKID